MPRVSVVMAVYNGERFLRQAIDSILSQTYTDFEFIVVNDGSTDSTCDILASYQQVDQRLRPYDQENRGLIASLNTGCGLAQGKYIARMDADDISLPERLVRQVRHADAHPEIGVLGTWVEYIDECGAPRGTWRMPTSPGVVAWYLLFGNCLAHPSVLMRRDVIGQMGCYCPEALYAEDYDLWRRLRSVTHLANLPDVLLCLRRHGDSVSSTHLAAQRDSSIKISQIAITETLGEDVPLQLVQRLWAQQFQTPSELLQIARLIYALSQESVSDSALSPAERRIIRSDAANRLLRLARPRIRDARVWVVIGLACRLDPSLVARVAMSIFHRMIREPVAS